MDLSRDENYLIYSSQSNILNMIKFAEGLQQQFDDSSDQACIFISSDGYNGVFSC